MEAAICSDWTYRAEGSKSLTIANRKTGIVYRILKSSVKQNSDNRNDVGEQYVKLVQYCYHVMKKLYLNFNADMKILSVGRDFLEKIDRKIKPDRPAHRLDKEIASANVVLEMPDYAFINKKQLTRYILPNTYDNNYCLTLKLKSVIRNYSDNLLTPCRKVPHCYTCVDRQLECGEEDVVSRFCPLELFSGDEEICKSSIQQLLMDLNLFKNRLGFFKNGVEMLMTDYDDIYELLLEFDEFSDQMSNSLADQCLSELTNVLHEAFNHKFTSQTDPKSDSLSGSVLDVYYRAQQIVPGLKKLDRAYELLKQKFTEQPKLEELFCMSGPYNTEMWDLNVRPTAPGVSKQVIDAFITVRNYLIYRTIIDGSIMITLQPIPRNQVYSRNSESSHGAFMVNGDIASFLCNISIIDVDPKPFSKLPLYLKREQLVSETVAKRWKISR